MIFKVYKSENVLKIFFSTYIGVSLILCIALLFGLLVGSNLSVTFLGIMFLLVNSLLSLSYKFQKNSFSILFCFFTLLFINIPIVFVILKGGDYIFGYGVAPIPYSQDEYKSSLPFGIAFLTISWFAIWLGVVLSSTKQAVLNYGNFEKVRVLPVFIISVFVLIVAWQSNQSIVNAQLESTNKIVSLLPFIFSDAAFLLLAGMILFSKLSLLKNIKDNNILNLLSFIFFLFMVVQYISAGGKGAIMQISMVLILIPFALLVSYKDTKIAIPKIKYIYFFILLAPLLYYIVSIQRISLGSNIEPDLGTLLNSLALFKFDDISGIFNNILYRLTSGGLDRFLLVFHSFVFDSYNFNTTLDFILYISKNTLNLLLPGTPFIEAYAPSSQLFPYVISNLPMNGEFTPSKLVRSLNTQPYTIFGIFMIFFGLLSPFFLCIFTFFYIKLYFLMNSLLVRLVMLMFFTLVLSSFGIEVSLANSIHLFVSMLFMFYLLLYLSRFRLGLFKINAITIKR